ncbi:class I adenylate-forming enzyme family protein [Sphingobium sp. HWE2-09]|uniref:class I adenylate-forming enzyme family protein n=1 Tax=Sphingobium sp. HWE2-09 TaxID=3108390 RepID=UPI002DD0B1D8|nr:class I adenylate-forming enzyme family protein [Sphingobium sp. HWE2-09]
MQGCLSLRHEFHHGRLVRAVADRHKAIVDMLDAAVLRAPDRIALVDGDLRMSYRSLSDAVERTARLFVAKGVQAGARIALLLANRADFVVAMLAAARLGAICVPMNIRQKRQETAHMLADSGAMLLLHEADLRSEIPDAADIPDVQHQIAVDDAARIWAVASGPGDALPMVPQDEDDIFCILYTSGTTGRPKGAVLTQFGVITSCIGAVAAMGLSEGEVDVVTVPLSHVTGIVLNVMTVLHLAGTVVLHRAFKARHFLETAQAERMTYSSVVPAMLLLCLREPDFAAFDLSAWRVCAFGGAPMPDSAVEALATSHPALRLSNIYGATETTSPSVIMPAAEAASRSDQVGRPLAYCDLVILDEDGREVERGGQGEIWIGGPHVVPRYWNNAEATLNEFTGGLWRSGDIGAMDADGFVRLYDRSKDVINRGGYKIYSVEVENILMAHPVVVEAAVVGKPCPVLGERVHAFVVLGAEAGAHGALLRQWCAQRLSDYKVPDMVEAIAGPLPRNANGKLLKRELRLAIGTG